jgi:hypothetical protein
VQRLKRNLLALNWSFSQDKSIISENRNAGKYPYFVPARDCKSLHLSGHHESARFLAKARQFLHVKTVIPLQRGLVRKA